MSRFSRRIFSWLLFALFGVSAAGLRADPNGVEWNYINLPVGGSVGQTVYFSASVTNSGTAAWVGDHYLELSDAEGAHLNYVTLGPTLTGGTRTVAFELKLPAQPGTYTYHFKALQHGATYFGPIQTRTIAVHLPPLEVSLSIETPSIVVGQPTLVRSAAGPDDAIAEHGVEARLLGGRWQKWAEWDESDGEPQIAFPRPEHSGLYEVRAYAVREGETEPAYSPRASLIVEAIPPAISVQPVGAVVNVGQAVTLAVTATGSELIFQWRRNGRNLASATRSRLDLVPAQVAQSGTYDVVVSNSVGSLTSRTASVTIAALALPAMAVDVWNFPAGSPRRSVALTAAQVGDVLSLQSLSSVTAGAGWRHNLLVRRPGVSAETALAPEDGSGLTPAGEAWNKDGWGNPHAAGIASSGGAAGVRPVDLGNREPFIHVLTAGQSSSTRSVDFVLDAPGVWLVRAEVVDAADQTIALSSPVTVTVAGAAMVGDIADVTYPYGRDDKFVGVFWNAGQAHRLWSTWRPEFRTVYPETWAVNWKLMWQPSPYFRRADGGWLLPRPAAESPWQSFWSAHEVFALVPDGAGRSTLSHDLTSQAFAEKAALRLMDIGVDFVGVDYTNQFLEENEDVFPAVAHLAQAFQALAQRSQSGQPIKLSAVVPANISSGDWGASGGFGPRAIARFNSKLTTLYDRFARFDALWFYLSDDNGARKPLLMLWVGAGGETEPDGSVPPALLDQLRLNDGRKMTDVFTIRWVGAYLPANRRFLTGNSYSVAGSAGTVSGRYAKAKFWSYREDFPAAATLMPGAGGASPAIEAMTVQPLAEGHDRFGRGWDENWPAGEGYHYETPTDNQPISLANYGRTWAEALTVARALNPKILLTTWAEFGSENDEPRPELSVTIMDNNKFGTHFGDALKQTVRRFKYRPPTGWIDTVTTSGTTNWLVEMAPTPVLVGLNKTLGLQGWVNPNVATTFAGGSVRILIDERPSGVATVGGAWNGATRWWIDLPVSAVGPGVHSVKVVLDDGNGGTALAGLQFHGDAPRSALPFVVSLPGTGSVVEP